MVSRDTKQGNIDIYNMLWTNLPNRGYDDDQVFIQDGGLGQKYKQRDMQWDFRVKTVE